MNLILGIPPLNQYDAAATSLRDRFTSEPDFSKYQSVPIQFAKGANPAWIQATKSIDFSKPDADRDKLQQAIAKSEGLPQTAASRAKPVGK